MSFIKSGIVSSVLLNLPVRIVKWHIYFGKLLSDEIKTVVDACFERVERVSSIQNTADDERVRYLIFLQKRKNLGFNFFRPQKQKKKKYCEKALKKQ